MSYDAWKEAAPEDEDREPPVDCPVCTGDEDAAPCTEECDALIQQVRRERQIRGFYTAARRALLLAKAYRFASSPEIAPRLDQRIRDIVRQVDVYRAEIAKLRSAA